MSSEKMRRRQMAADAATPPAGIYRIVNQITGRVLLGSSENLRGVQNRFEFAVSTNSPGALDQRLVGDAKQHGLSSFTFEVLDTLEPSEEPTSLSDDLRLLEELWRGRFPSARWY